MTTDLVRSDTQFISDFPQDIWNQTYKYHTDGNVSDTHWRIATDLASEEKDSEYWAKKFYEALSGFKVMPGGRISSNAGTGLKGATYINCFTPTAKVLTSNGPVQISNVRVGDKVLTHRGRWRKVVTTMSREYSGDVYKYNSSRITDELISTPEHPFYQGNEEWKNAKDNNRLVFVRNLEDVGTNYINLEDYLDNSILPFIITEGNKLNISKKIREIKDASSEIAINSRFKLTKSLAYAFGRFLKFGESFKQFNSYKYTRTGFNICFNEFEIDCLNVVKLALEDAFGAKLNISNENNNFNFILHNSPLMGMFFSTAFGDKYYNKKIPKFIWQASPEIQMEFLKGISDIDEEVHFTRAIKVIFSNKELIKDLQTLAHMVGLSGPKIKKDASISRNKSYCNNTPIGCRRDNYSLVNKIGEHFYMETDKIVDHYKGLVYNISVEEDESYSVNNVIVHNCFVGGPVVKDKDSVEGIFNALTRAALTLKSEGGYGFCADFIRPRGAFIYGVGVETPGAVEMLKLWDQMSAVITKGSGQKKTKKEGKNKIRKGAMMVTMSCWHPDITEFITAKQNTGELSKFNMSVLCTDEFMDAVEKKKPWNLLFPDTTFENYKEEWDGNIKAWQEKGYPTIVYKTLSSASELWDLIMKSTYNRNEPGILFHDRINDLNNLNYIEHISATNPCVVKGTLVNTPLGYKRVEEIVQGECISTVRGSEPVESIETHKGLEVFKVKFADGGSETVTAAHKYHAIREGTNHKKYTDIRLDELNIGDSVRVAPAKMHKGSEADYIRGAKIGVLLGDGCYSPAIVENSIIKIASSTDDVGYNQLVKKLFGGASFFNKDNVSRTSKTMNMILRNGPMIINDLGLIPALSYNKDFDICQVRSEKMAIGIIDGLLATDGNINLTTNHPQIRIMTSSAKLAQTIRRLFIMIGAHARINTCFKDDGGIIDGRKIVRRHPKNTIVVNSSSIIPLVEKTRLIELHPEKGAKLLETRDMWALTGGNWRTKIVSIEPYGKSDVYDLYCLKSDTWITSGYVQKGCGEQLLAKDNVCLLGSLNLTQFINEKKNNWDYDSLAKYIPIFVRMLDNVNDRTLVPLPEQKMNLINKRRIGVGYLGYGSALYMMKTKYGSRKAIKLTDELASFVTNECYRASALLAKEKGAFPKYDKEKYLKSKFIAQALNKETVNLISKYGIRNSHLTSIQPTGNSSVYANNVSGGLEPVVSAEYYRTVIVPIPPDGLNLPNVNWDNRSFSVSDDIEWKWVKEGDESLLLTKFNEKVYKFDRNRGLVCENLVEDYAVHILKESGDWDSKADWAVDIFNLTIKEHIDTMKSFAKYIDAAMSKCIAKGTLINTSEGIFRIEDLGDTKSADSFSKPISENMFVLDEDGNKKRITSHYYGGKKPCKTIQFNNGYKLTGSLVHKVKTNQGWVSLNDLKIGDKVFYRTNLLEVDNNRFVKLPEVEWESHDDRFNFSKILDTDFALFLGMWMADGFTNINSVCIVEKDSSVRNEVIRTMTAVFGVSPQLSIDKRNGVRTHYINSRALSEYFREYFGTNSATKKLSDELLQSNHDIWRAFLSGLTLNGNLHSKGLVIYNGYSKNICDGIKCMLSGLGIESLLFSRNVKNGNKHQTVWGIKESFNSDGFLKIESAKEHNAIIDYDLTYISITNIEDAGEVEVYDIEVEDTHSYLLDGVVSHNTINLPKDYPYEDFKSLYNDMYKSGVIKGGTTYREGTMTNVLSITSSEDKDDGNKIAQHSAPKRPKSLECNVHYLKVGGERWIVFVGLLDGMPYEVFAGLMENVYPGNKVRNGQIVKYARNKYGFVSDDMEIRDINAAFNNATQSALTRMASMSLRHGVDIKFVVTQLLKTGNGLNTFAKCLARTLKKYINEGTELPDVSCPQCSAKTIVMTEGCNKCLTCGASSCA